eukprot:464047-Rhodomonas_salina.1
MSPVIRNTSMCMTLTKTKRFRFPRAKSLSANPCISMRFVPVAESRQEQNRSDNVTLVMPLPGFGH